MAALRVLVVAEGSGGHLIPALQTSQALSASGAEVLCWYAVRSTTAVLLVDRCGPASAVRLEPLPIRAGGRHPAVRCLWDMIRLWRAAQRQFRVYRPQIVVGFGGWTSIPVLLAARRRRIPTLIHEQNAALGRANRLLKPWVDLLALSFPPSTSSADSEERLRTPTVLTGLPTRGSIGAIPRAEAARQLGCEAARPTVLVVGGSQGSHALNHLACRMAAHLTEAERTGWQILHLTGPAEEAQVDAAYCQAEVRAIVQPYLADMQLAYAAADVVISRAGASTIAELARCGLPGILIPYPYAGGHQRHNAQLVERLGGGVCCEESQVQPDQLLALLRRLLSDARLRGVMGQQMRTLAQPDAAGRLADVILRLADSPVVG